MMIEPAATTTLTDTKRRSSYFNKSGRGGRHYANYQRNTNTEYYQIPHVYYYPHSCVYYSYEHDIVKNTRDDLEIIVHKHANTSPDQYKSIDLKKQLEYYFSRQNLVNDTYLVSHMDSEMYVPISLIASFKRVREWTSDINIIVKTLRESPSVIVDESGTKVKPNISLERNTVILRDMPECTEQDVTELLKSLNLPPVQSMIKDIGNMWYISFESEQDALKSLDLIKGKTFKDKPIAARMKSESVLRVQTRTAVTPPLNQNITAIEENRHQHYRFRYNKKNSSDSSTKQNPFENHKTNQVGGRSQRVGYKPKYHHKQTKHETDNQISTDLSNMAINDIPSSPSSTYTATSNKGDTPITTNDSSPATPDDLQPLPQQPPYYKSKHHKLNLKYNSHTHTNHQNHQQLQRSLRNQHKSFNNQRNGYVNKKRQYKLASRDERRQKYVADNLKPSQFPPLPNQSVDELEIQVVPMTRSATDIVKTNPKIIQLQEQGPPRRSSYADILKKKE